MANYFLREAFMPSEQSSFTTLPITLPVERCCKLMGISKSTFYRRQAQRLEAKKRMQDGENSIELYEILAFPELLSDGIGSRTFVRYADIISWSERLKGRAQS